MLTPMTVLQTHPRGGEGAGSMAGRADPSQLESERELCPHTTGYSSELNRQIEYITVDRQQLKWMGARSAARSAACNDFIPTACVRNMMT